MRRDHGDDSEEAFPRLAPFGQDRASDRYAGDTEMKKLILGFVVGGALGAFAGFAGGIFVFPYWFPPPPAMETVANLAEQKVLARGDFIHANPSDPVHWGKGKVTLYESKGGDRLVHQCTGSE